MFFFRKRKFKKTAPPSPATPVPFIRPLPQDPKLRRAQLCHDLRHIAGQGEGLRYLARLVTLSGALGSSYSPAGAEASAYNEGLRRMGLFILAEVRENAPDLLPRLLRLCLDDDRPPGGQADAPLQ